MLQNKGNLPLRVACGWAYSPSAYLLTYLVEFKKLRIGRDHAITAAPDRILSSKSRQRKSVHTRLRIQDLVAGDIVEAIVPKTTSRTVRVGDGKRGRSEHA